MGPMKLANRWPIYSPGYRGKTNLYLVAFNFHDYGEAPDFDGQYVFRVRARTEKQAMRKLRKRYAGTNLYPWRKPRVVGTVGVND